MTKKKLSVAAILIIIALVCIFCPIPRRANGTCAAMQITSDNETGIRN